MAARPRVRTRVVHVPAPKTRLDKIREWANLFWPAIIVIGGAAWAWGSSQWHDYAALKTAVGTASPPTGLHKSLHELDDKIDKKSADLTAKVDQALARQTKSLDGQAETHALINSLRDEVRRSARR